jgi:hypothetical protein
LIRRLLQIPDHVLILLGHKQYTQNDLPPNTHFACKPIVKEYECAAGQIAET